MNTKLLSAIVLTSLSCTAFAGVADKKAMKNSESRAAGEIENMQKICGNTSLAISFSWDKYEKMISANTEEIKKQSYKSEWVYGKAGDRAWTVLSSLKTICRDDADYKEAIAQISNIVVNPKEKLSDAKSSYSVSDDGKTITMELGHIRSEPSDLRGVLLDIF